MCCERAVSGMTSGFESAPPKWFGNSLHGTSATLRMNHSRFAATIVRDIPMSLFVFSLCVENYHSAGLPLLFASTSLPLPIALAVALHLAEPDVTQRRTRWCLASIQPK